MGLMFACGNGHVAGGEVAFCEECGSPVSAVTEAEQVPAGTITTKLQLVETQEDGLSVAARAVAAYYAALQAEQESAGSAGEVELSETSFLIQEISRLVELVSQFNERSVASEETIRKMRARIEELEAEQSRLYSKAVIRKIARLHAQLAYPNVKGALPADAPEGQFSAGVYWDRSEIADGAAEVEDILDSMDVESIDTQVGDFYDSAKHNARDVVATSDPGLDKTIQRVVTQGFNYIGSPRVLLPADVVIYRYEG